MNISEIALRVEALATADEQKLAYNAELADDAVFLGEQLFKYASAKRREGM